MFGSQDEKKRKLEAAYGRGMETARQTGALEQIGEGIGSLILPDSMGTEEYQSYKKGYNDYINSNGAKRAASLPKEPTPLDPSEKAWFALCDASKFIPDDIVSRYQRALLAQGNQGSFYAGLSKFTAHTRPRCGAAGQFRVHFLGRLRHPDCGWEGYMGTGSYIGFQFLQTLHTGYRAGGSIKADGDKKGEQHTWVSAVFGFFFVAVFRAAAAFVLIPVHIVVGLCQAGQSKEELVKRAAWLGALLALVGIGWYEAKDLVNASPGMRNTAQISTPAVYRSGPVSPPATSTTASTTAPSSYYALLDKNQSTASNWEKIAETGSINLTFFNPQPMEVSAQPTDPPSGVTLYTKQVLRGDLDSSFVFNHQGFGRTMVGLWSTATNNWAALAILDTNDTNFLAFSVGGPSTEGKYSGSGYMNKWIVVRIRIVGTRAYFFADGVQLEGMDFVPGEFRLAVNVGCASWKSGANDTSFRLISAMGKSN